MRPLRTLTNVKADELIIENPAKQSNKIIMDQEININKFLFVIKYKIKKLLPYPKPTLVRKQRILRRRAKSC